MTITTNVYTVGPLRIASLLPLLPTAKPYPFSFRVLFPRLCYRFHRLLSLTCFLSRLFPCLCFRLHALTISKSDLLSCRALTAAPLVFRFSSLSRAIPHSVPIVKTPC